ncbi:hypothetical protein J7T55_014063, partial [Diaporthe amygdali]|uniref:uncharacterized protein n=1 Tax=Phomopsis amygdali TaxID=1214568 RepID=UPI0022FE3E88
KQDRPSSPHDSHAYGGLFFDAVFWQDDEDLSWRFAVENVLSMLHTFREYDLLVS